ncbi:hypothetical protein DEU56DRAFT_982317 [Suillus clintonianus]|uniref:uncharacterized protein n=1 Tax=Suillus clintonianus TaxID=1904413 RepID=UPI001B879454|nr:uncharacterized protein DEU56DRAFT_982317 [Suillus clintonianus]KAG2129442.1 hypothetical protein DEU56DRAFT_982317 [Suillus clintonianus]
MRSHLSPYSARSYSGSAPAPSARVFNLSRSNSSRPSANSAHSCVVTTSSASLNSGRPLGTDPLTRTLSTMYPTANAQGAIVASMPAGSLVGALSVTYLGDKLGRKKTIILGGLFWAIGSILQ